MLELVAFQEKVLVFVSGSAWVAFIRRSVPPAGIGKARVSWSRPIAHGHYPPRETMAIPEYLIITDAPPTSGRKTNRIFKKGSGNSSKKASQPLSTCSRNRFIVNSIMGANQVVIADDARRDTGRAARARGLASRRTIEFRAAAADMGDNFSIPGRALGASLLFSPNSAATVSIGLPASRSIRRRCVATLPSGASPSFAGHRTAWRTW